MNPSLRNDPLVIFGSPRGGTSLVAGIFAAHGFWVGHPFALVRGYPTYENARIKAVLKRHWTFTAGTLLQNPRKANLAREIASIAHTTGPWMFKCAAEYYEIFRYWFPEMKAVMVFRELEQAIVSAERYSGSSGARAIVTQRYAFMREIAEKGGAHCANADDVVAGDFTCLIPITEEYGIPFRGDLAKEVIRPALWHSHPAGET